MEVLIKKHHPKAKIPRYATEGSAAVDLHACIDEPVTIAPGGCVVIPAGFSVSMHGMDISMELLPRSGLGIRDGIVLANLIGLIDSDFMGEIQIALWNRNTSGEPFVVNPQDRICQAKFAPVIRVSFREVAEFPTISERNEGGLGSTGR